MDGNSHGTVADLVPSFTGRKNGSSEIIFANTWNSYTPKKIEADMTD